MNNNFGDTKELIEIKEIKYDTVILKNGGLRQIIVVGGINFALKSEEEQNIIIQAYQDFLNSLEFPIQIVIHSRKINIEKYLNYLKEQEKNESSELLKNQMDEYIEFIRGFVKENAIMTKTFFVVVPYFSIDITSETKNVISKISFLSSKNNQSNSSANQNQSLIESINQLNQRTNDIIEGLAAIGLDAVRLGNEELLELFYNYYNPETIEKESVKI
jgi:type IV secretory pathway VirB4 component